MSDKPPGETYAFKHGGLLRCSILSLDDEMVRRQQAGEPLTAEGDVIPCRYCDQTMICKEGYWQWNH